MDRRFIIGARDQVIRVDPAKYAPREPYDERVKQALLESKLAVARRILRDR
jgi:hypothetical protein